MKPCARWERLVARKSRRHDSSESVTASDRLSDFSPAVLHGNIGDRCFGSCAFHCSTCFSGASSGLHRSSSNMTETVISVSTESI